MTRNPLTRLLDNYRAWRRGERRIAPHGVRGRVYGKREAPPKTNHQPKVSISAKVTRADGSVETHRLTDG